MARHVGVNSVAEEVLPEGLRLFYALPAFLFPVAEEDREALHESISRATRIWESPFATYRAKSEG